MKRNGQRNSPNKSEKETLIEAALMWADNGVPVFPCSFDKRPLTSNGFYDASVDPATVRQQFDRDDVLIGARMGQLSGLFAIDFDLYKKAGAREYMDELAQAGLLVETRTHRTMQGGLHMVYASETAWPNVNPCSGVEVKGEGGYIIVPPSRGYETLREGVSTAPNELVNRLMIKRATRSAESTAAIKEQIINASNFHDSLTRLAAKLSGAGWLAGAVMQELQNALRASVAADPNHPRHVRWKSLLEDKGGELSRIINSGHHKYNSFVVGEEASDLDLESAELRNIASAFGFKTPPRGKEQPELPEQEAIKQIKDFTGWPFEGEGYFAHVDHDLLSQKFIMHPILCEEESILVAAEPKTGKTAICLTVALHIACGLDLGDSLRVAEPRSVLYFGLEGRRAIRLRIAAWRKKQKENNIELPEHIPLFVVEKPKNLLKEEVRQTLANQIKAAELYIRQQDNPPLGAMFIDTFTKAMPGGDQNAVEDTSSVFDVVSRVRELDVTAAVIFIHHKSRAGNIRGSTNIEAEPDVLTSIQKEGSAVRWHLDRARSVEEGGAYHFELENYHIGVSTQGFPINAPVVIPLDSGAVAERAEIEEARETNETMTLIISFGNGKHDLKLIYDALYNRGLGPKRVFSRAKSKLKVTSATAQEFFESLIPDTGYSFGGKTVEKVRDEKGKVSQLYVR